MDMRRSVHQKRDADQAQERADPRNPNPGGCDVRIAVMAAGASEVISAAGWLQLGMM